MSTDCNRSNSQTGIDEAGRGALAGPVVIAALTGPIECLASLGLKDSKELSFLQRERFFSLLTGMKEVSFAFVAIDSNEIDCINIRQAVLQGMRLSADLLASKSFPIIIDGVDAPVHDSVAIIKADCLYPAVSAASIVAKVIRDRIMLAYSKIYPLYGFEQHKGYGTLMHRNAIATYGLSNIHRKTFCKNIVRN